MSSTCKLFLPPITDHHLWRPNNPHQIPKHPWWIWSTKITDTAVLTFLWPVSLMMQINFCHITDLQDNVFFLAWTIWNNSYNIYQVFLFHLIFLICSLWNPFELCKENILQKQNKPLCVNLQKYIQRQIRHTDSFVRTKFKENSQGCPSLFLRQTLSCT